IRYRRGIVDIVDRDGLQSATCECYEAVRRQYERLAPPPPRVEAGRA
ncbi:MAG: Crp/Fnr family transcriptional regulator, partial [Proteobacteria bacterium]|nr:Crp/Fnr family transcriptional regulator [Pseudomonadota bacterium]